MTIGAPQADMSPIRAAGKPPISTVASTGGAITDGGCTAGGGNEQMCGVADRRRRHPGDQHGGHAGRPDHSGVTGGVTDPSCWWHFRPTSLFSNVSGQRPGI